MDQEHLSKVLKSASVHRQIVGDYTGVYSIGITLNPKNKKQLAIRLRVEGDDLERFPSFVRVNKEVIPVIVNGRFLPPSAATRSYSRYRLRTKRTPSSLLARNSGSPKAQ